MTVCPPIMSNYWKWLGNNHVLVMFHRKKLCDLCNLCYIKQLNLNSFFNIHVFMNYIIREIVKIYFYIFWYTVHSFIFVDTNFHGLKRSVSAQMFWNWLQKKWWCMLDFFYNIFKEASAVPEIECLLYV